MLCRRNSVLAIFLLCGLVLTLRADTIFSLSEKGDKVNTEGIVIGAKGAFIQFLRLDRGVFMVMESLVAKAEKSSPGERQTIIERWKLAGWTANVTLAGGIRKRIFNLDLRYPPPKGMEILGRKETPEDVFVLQTGKASVSVKFSDTDRMGVAQDGTVGVALRSGSVIAGHIPAVQLSNGVLRPTFHGVEQFVPSGTPIWFDADLADVREIVFEKHDAAPTTAPKVPALTTARPGSLRMGVVVVLMADCPLKLHGRLLRTGHAGEKLKVLSYAPESPTVELMDHNNHGDVIDITAPWEDIALDPSQK